MRFLAVAIALLAIASSSLAGGALRFDGNDVVDIPPILGPALRDRVTVEAWIHYVHGGGHHRIISHFSGCGAYTLFIPHEDDDKLELEIRGLGRFRSARPIPYDRWVHVAGVYDGGSVRLYLDGEEILNETAQGPIPDCPTVHIAIGSDDGVHHFRGTIDEVRLWSIARSQEEIDRDRSQVLRGDEEGLEGYWRFEEGEGQIAADSSVHGHDGQLGWAPGPDGADPTWIDAGAPVFEIRVDRVVPETVPTAGGEVCLEGSGFDPEDEIEIRIEGRTAQVVSAAEDRVCLLAPPHEEGSAPLEILTARRRGTATLSYHSVFLRGDVTGDGLILLDDPIALLNHLFAGGAISCADAADGNDSGGLDIADAIGLLVYMFADGLAPRGPFPEPGTDPTPDGLRCGR